MTPAVDGDERLNVKDDPAADEPRQDLRKEVQSEPDRSRGTDGKTIWPSPFSEGNARGPLPRREVSSSTSDRLPLLACPVADSEAIGIYDLRVPCHCARLSQPSVLLKCSSSLSSFNYGAVAGGSWDGGGWGMVQCLAGVSKLGPTPHVAAAYELPCVALWDIRQPRCPLSQIPLPPSSPPSCLAVFRNRLWVGCFDGDLTVLDIRRDGTFRLPPRDHIHLSGEKEFPGRSCCSSAPSGLSSLPHPEGDVSHAQLLLSAAFRPDGALVAVGASDGAFRLFETKTGRCLGSLSPRDAFRTGSEAAGCCLAWCESTGVLATGCGGGRIVLWGPYLETYGGRRCQKQ
ncbi:glycosyltransferase family 28 c-terminal domain-containing [Cystoisospora suis]|uniref:Glycosyltransferase family 28 c-terminal domain-containing n=1 Tax=Cystoisospora suis TaxID=483139 RepID=A0A2C6KEF6_9APIC|nr:glycosyltransferase family 28 c-terminal domain-containing [Cystoisospora suis]